MTRVRYFAAAEGLSMELASEYAGVKVVGALHREGILSARLRHLFVEGSTLASARESMRYEIGEAMAFVGGA